MGILWERAMGGGDGNETENLTLEIISPENITYFNDTILINILSNGDFVSFMINNGTEEIYNGSEERVFEEGGNLLEAFANNSEGEDATDSVTFFVDLDDGNQTGNSTG